MEFRVTTKQLMRGFIYLLGILMTGLGVTVLLRSTLGAGAWDTVVYNLRAFFEHVLLLGVTLGTVSFIINLVVLSCIMLYHKKLKFMFVLIPIFGVALAIDFWDIIVLGNYIPNELFIRIVFFLGGIFILTLGLSLMLVTKYPAMVFDELTLIVMKTFSIKSFFVSRIIIELSAIVLATILGFSSSIGFGAVNFGSFLLAIILGPIIELQLKYLTLLTKPLFQHNNNQV